MAETGQQAPGTPDDIENMMGLFLMTFGQGVNPLHVRLSVVRAIRARLLPPLTRAVKDPNWHEVWKAEAAAVLGFMAAVGRLAAQIAMEPQDRRTVVNPSDFETAMDLVIKEHHFAPAESPGDVHVLGKWCM